MFGMLHFFLLLFLVNAGRGSDDRGPICRFINETEMKQTSLIFSHSKLTTRIQYSLSFFLFSYYIISVPHGTKKLAVN